MPLVKRSVEPALLCRQSISEKISSELEYVTNITLSGVIHQLSSLSFHAEDLFGELFSEASAFYARASKLQDRIEKLNQKVTKLDSSVEEVSLYDINQQKAFRSSGITDQQVVSRESLSRTLIDTYNRADKPPPLSMLTPYRDDGKDALKIYTDPDYFFNLWREAMQKEMRNAKEKRREKREKVRKANPSYRAQRKVKQAVANQKIKAQQRQYGAEFVDLSKPQSKAQNHVNGTTTTDSLPPAPPPNSIDLPPPTALANTPPKTANYQPETIEPPPPPPPPPPSILDGTSTLPPPVDLPAPPPPTMPDVSTSVPHLPPPPPPEMNSVPPPPPPISGGSVPPPPPPILSTTDATVQSTANQGGLADQLANVRLQKMEQNNAPPPVVDDRSNLLQAIRLGINLKKVEQREKTEATTSSANDVASILARRIAVEFSDTESESYDSDDDDDWS